MNLTDHRRSCKTALPAVQEELSLFQALRWWKEENSRGRWGKLGRERGEIGEEGRGGGERCQIAT